MDKSTNMEKKILFIIQAVAVIALLITVVVVFILFSNASTVEPPETTAPTVTQPVTDPTETTAPPIPTNPFTPGEFQYEGDYLACMTAESILGIDVSSYQGSIDWAQVKAAGIEFVIIRVGGRGYGDEGELYADENAQSYYEGAKAAGLKVGAYFFSQAITEEEAREEAQFVLSHTADWELEMPIVFDWEFVKKTARTGNMDARTLTDCTKAFCQEIENAGHEAMIYFNPDHGLKQVYLEELLDYKFWLAFYSDFMDYPYAFDMWQYTETGTVPGISGDVDINLYLPEA